MDASPVFTPATLLDGHTAQGVGGTLHLHAQGLQFNGHDGQQRTFGFEALHGEVPCE